ncbi:MAG: hypothetical protein ACLU8Y_01900 [Clostridia bacterium]
MRKTETKNNEIKVKKLPFAVLNNAEIIKVFEGNGIVEVESMQKAPFSLNRFVRLSKTEYVDKETGEIKKYNTTKTRNQNPNELRKSFKLLRRLINYNFCGRNNEKHITLTYGELIQDYKQVNKDFRQWWRVIKRYFPNLEYICVMEYQARGSIHLHILVKDISNEDLPLEQTLLDKTWTKGFSEVTEIKSNSNLGAYFSARFTDIDLNEDIQNENTSKLILKGARLKFYKTGQKIFTTSRGIVRNKGHTVTQEELEEITKGAKMVYADSKVISKINDKGKEIVVNTITYQQFNKNVKE